MELIIIIDRFFLNSTEFEILISRVLVNVIDLYYYDVVELSVPVNHQFNVKNKSTFSNILI